MYEFRFNILVFLIMAHPQNLVLAPRATIPDNTVSYVFTLLNIMSNAAPKTYSENSRTF